MCFNIRVRSCRYRYEVIIILKINLCLPLNTITFEGREKKHTTIDGTKIACTKIQLKCSTIDIWHLTVSLDSFRKKLKSPTSDLIKITKISSHIFIWVEKREFGLKSKNLKNISNWTSTKTMQYRTTQLPNLHWTG